MKALARWMDSWTGLGAVVVGMTTQGFNNGFNVELKEYAEDTRELLLGRHRVLDRSHEEETNEEIAVLILLLVFAPLSAMVDTWGDQINDPSRFVVLPGYNGAAVLDRETGLVWEQSPDTTLGRSWFNAHYSLQPEDRGEPERVAPSHHPRAGEPHRPHGAISWPHPPCRPSLYHCAVRLLVSYYHQLCQPGVGVVFNFGEVFVDDKAGAERVVSVWCVRGGHGVDPQ